MRVALLTVAAAFFGCVSAPVRPAAPTSLSNVDPVHLSVLRYIIAGWSDDRPRYICVYDADPPPPLLTALQPWSPTPLLPCCAMPHVALPIGHRSPFVRIRIVATLSRTPTSAVIQAGFQCGWQCEGLADYHCVRDDDGRWHIARVTNDEQA